MSSINDLRQMSLAQLKTKTKEEIHAILQKDTDNAPLLQGLQEGINEINRKLNDEVIKKLDEIPQMRKEMDELKATVDKQAAVIEQQQRFMEQLDARDRSHNLIITGVKENQNLRTATTDREKCNMIFGMMDLPEMQFDEKRLGKQVEGRARPILVTLKPGEDRNKILSNTKKLKQSGDDFKDIYVKKDTHPAVRKEWKRLFDAKREEEQKAENAGVAITMDFKQRALLRDGVIIDKWRPSFFL